MKEKTFLLLLFMTMLFGCEKIVYLPKVEDKVTVEGNIVTFLLEIDKDDMGFIPQVEYDTNAIFGSSEAVELEPRADSGSYEIVLRGLQPYTTYYYRYIVSNSAGGGIIVNHGSSFTTMEATSTVNGCLSGCFSVSSNQTVCFSRGNLQYRASSNTWRFALNQYDYIGFDNRNISESYNGWIDLFGWGTSGFYYGPVCYQPWSTSTSSTYYGDSFYNSSGSVDLTGNMDWGYNAISNGGNTTNTWRTLTKEEWKYLFLSRSTSTGIRFAKAIVNNINGVVLLPDEWNTSVYDLHNTNNMESVYSSNIIDKDQWNCLQDAGAVFLPAAGRRENKTIVDLESCGYYWSSSYYNYQGAYILGFDYSEIHCEYIVEKHYGLSVRLVYPID